MRNLKVSTTILFTPIAIVPDPHHGWMALTSQRDRKYRSKWIERMIRARSREEGENPMKESTLAKITASVAAAKGMAQKALAASPNPQWTEYEIQSVDEWIASQGLKIDRSEAIRRLVEIGLTASQKAGP